MSDELFSIDITKAALLTAGIEPAHRGGDIEKYTSYESNFFFSVLIAEWLRCEDEKEAYDELLADCEQIPVNAEAVSEVLRHRPANIFFKSDIESMQTAFIHACTPTINAHIKLLIEEGGQ